MKNRISAICLLLLSSVSMSISADPYIGLSAGSADYTVDLSSLNPSSQFEDDGTGTKIYGGYTFGDYFAAELSYYNFAEASVGALETSPGSGNFVSGSADMTGFGAYAIGIYPASKSVNLMAKLGVLNWNADLSFNDRKGSNDGTDLAFAVAASYAFTKELLGVAEWESFDTDNPEVSLLSIGFRFVFK